LRFWHLGTIPGPVFDEVYFPVYGYDYLIGKTFFNVTPPLAEYIFAGSIWLYYHMPFVSSVDFHSTPFSEISAISYRWINALMGVVLCLVAWLTAYSISQRKWFALIIFFLISIDGSLLVDSRHGMNNIYIVLFGLCAVLCMVRSVQSQNKSWWLLFCGIFLGLTISIKWNGLAYILAILMLCILYQILAVFDKYRRPTNAKYSADDSNVFNLNISYLEMLVYLLILPAIIYCLIWIPDLLFNTKYGFIEIHKQMLHYHEGVGSNVHPYCSKFYTWPFMLRPIGYSFSTETVHNALGHATTIYTDVHLFPNPAITLFSTIAIICMGINWLVLFVRWFHNGVITRSFMIMSLLLAGYCANLLPWAMVTRCLFLYHYQSSAVFAMFALSWYLFYLSTSRYKTLNLIAYFIFLCIIASFIYWVPFQLGITLEKSQFFQRMWLRSWI
jgi:dolichyl-phosphate-mannose--protein O-mannosyl transferase